MEGDLKNVEVVKVGRDRLARIVFEVDRFLITASHSCIQEVAISPIHYEEQDRSSHKVVKELDRPLPEHLGLGYSLLCANRELAIGRKELVKDALE